MSMNYNDSDAMIPVIVPLIEVYYSDFYTLVQTARWGNPMLPDVYDDSLWGDIVLQDDKVVGGWVGTLRGNGRLTKYIAKSVYFDAYPIFQTQELEQSYLTRLIGTVKQHAKNEHIVMLNLTHWVRGKQLPVDIEGTQATFCLSLHSDQEALWAKVESKQRNCIRKGEKSGVRVEICQGGKSLQYLSDFQRLRQTTQQHAIHKNANASMLLKSDDFFTEKFTDPKSTLFVGIVEDKVAAVALMLQAGHSVYYYSGGSDYELNKKYSCSAYLIWKAICYYNEKGMDCFDMGGVPVHPDESHPAYGVYRFKKSFGGEYQEFDGGQIVISPVRYKILHWLLGQRRLLRMFSNKL